MDAIIYYFSATGNSLDVAREVVGKIGGAKLVSLAPLSCCDAPAEDAVIGIIFPVYDWNMPLAVRDFIKRLDVSKAKYIFAAVTCNYLPGQTLESLKKMLEAKGKALNAGFIVRMPGTYIPLYGANSLRTQAHKFAVKHRKTDLIAKTVLAMKDRRNDRSPILIDRILGPKMEKQMDAFLTKDGEFIVEQQCNGCGTCAKVCPFDNIVMAEQKPVWQHKCQQCFACIHLCAKGCIQIGAKTKGKERYKNPNVSLKELINAATEDRLRIRSFTTPR